MTLIETTPSPSVRQTVSRTVGRLAVTLGHRVVEGVNRRPVRHASEVPSSAEGITAEWLSDVLCAGTSNAHVIGFEVSGGGSQTTSRASLRIQYNEEGRVAELPEEVFVKLTATLRQRMFLGLIRCIEGEPRFYRDIRPTLDIDCPRGYFGAVDPRSWRSIVLIEDIARTRNAEFCHATTHVSRSDIESLLEVMAGYHGAMWESPAIAGPGAAWLKTPRDHFHNTSAFLNMRKRCAVGIRRTEDVVPAAVKSNPDGLWAGLINSMQMASEGPITLLHGDPHVGNTYRTTRGMALADWQVCMRGSWGFDYAYAVSTALNVEDRRAWEQDLLNFYLERLAKAGGNPPEFKDAWKTYKQCLMYPLHTWTTVIGRSAFQPRMQEDNVSRLIIERVSHAINDLDAIHAFDLPRRA